MAIPWHRIFGMALTQYFAGTAWKVDVEVDLSLAQQRLDLAIVRRVGHSVEPVWPDGFGAPAEYNLLTFKALKDPLDPWAIKELSAHGVNYRKQISPNPDQLLPESQFRLLAASMRYPRRLASRVPLQPQAPGAYDVQWGTDTIRILVLREMPEADQNIVWNLFSGERDRIATAFQRIAPRPQGWSSLLNELLEYYDLEGMAMPYTMEDFERDAAENLLRKLPAERLRKYLTPEQLSSLLSAEQVLRTLTPEQRLAGLSAEQLLSLLPLEVIENYVRTHKSSQQNEAAEQPQEPS